MALQQRFPMSGPVSTRPALGLAALQAAARALGASAGGASRLLALLYAPEVDLRPVLDTLAREPALAARVLKVANSPFYGAGGRIGTLDQAVQLLGLTAIRGIAAAGCLDRVVPARTGPAFDPDRFRRHSLAVGCAAQGLSRSAGLGLDGEAFMAGLLHDIGIVLLVRAAPAALGEFEPASGGTAEAALAHEGESLGARHDHAVDVLAQAWQWPEWLRLAVSAHHAMAPPGGGPLRGSAALPGLLAIADHLADAAGLGLWPVCALPPPEGLPAALGLDPAALDAVRASLPAAVAALSAD